MNKLPVAIALAVAACAQIPAASQSPGYRVDPSWPKPLPEEDGVQLVLGQVAGIAVDDRNGHVWIIHRPATILADEWKEGKPVTHRCCKAAPPVVEFDAAGNYLRGWAPSDPKVQWPKQEHGMYVDPEGNLWLGGNGDEDNQILKFTADGKFLMQIGRAGKSEGSASRTQLGRPAHMMMDPKSAELYVAAGYGNHRVVVFDARSGAYKRHWGAYGAEPRQEKQPPYAPSAAPARQFGNPVHCVRLSNDGRVYVCDRVNNRIQVFEPTGRFVQEFRVEPLTRANGAVWDMVLSHDAAQKYLYVADGANGRVYILERATGRPLGAFGRPGRMAGEFTWADNIAIAAPGSARS